MATKDMFTLKPEGRNLTTSKNGFNVQYDDTNDVTRVFFDGIAKGSSSSVAIPDAATYTVAANDSGRVHILPDLTADITITLPAVADGLEYKFIYKGVAADAQDWIIDTGSATNFYLGGIVHLDTDAGSGGDEIVPVAPDGNSNDIFTVLVPDVGTEVNLLCDGTNWIVSGFVVSTTAPTFAD